MALSLTESQVVNRIASHIRDFLPANPHPYANQKISFAGIAHDLNLSGFWGRGSKLTAIIMLLEKTLELIRDRFCRLMVEVVRRGITYRNNKGNPITREEIRTLNKLIEQLNYRIPELWDPKFIDSLPSSQPKSEIKDRKEVLQKLRKDFTNLEATDPHLRGFEFEKFLKNLFEDFGLSPHSSFRIVGEQIDGSLQLDGEIYLVEAKWQKKPLGNSELLTFCGKVGGKSTWARGLIISYSGFSDDALIAFSRGRATNIIAMTGQDLYFILEGRMSLIEALRQKVRRAAETGQVLTTVYELSLST
jgi:hypothetical protein